MCSNRSRETCCQSGSRMNCIPSRRASFAAGTKSASPATRTTTSAWRFNVMAAISKPIRMSHALLAQRRGKVSIRDIIERHFTAQKAPLGPRLQNPGSVTVPAHFTETQGEVRTSAQRLEELVTEDRLLRLAVVDRMFVNGRVPLLVVWPGIVVEAAVQQRSGIRRLQGFVQLPKVTVDKLSNRIGNRLRVRCIDVRPDNGQARQD